MIRNEYKTIYTEAIEACLPDLVVKNALSNIPDFSGKLYMVAIGKAAWKMADTAAQELGDKLTAGVVITKYEHSMGEINNVRIFEAGHPIPDQNTLDSTKAALDLTEDLTEDDLVLFLISGGGSALFEAVPCGINALADMTAQLLAAGASIGEINTLRKHLSLVKGGRFAKHVYPAKIYAVILSDALGNDPSVIASGPACADKSTVADVDRIIEKYNLNLPSEVLDNIRCETPKSVSNVEYVIGGSVTELCEAARLSAEKCGFKTKVLTDCLDCEAREAGALLASIAKTYKDTDIPLAFIFGGETVVHLKGKGKGGRNQELALSAAKKISGLDNVVIFSVGSDGTDGPTDAAGGVAFGDTFEKIRSNGIDPDVALENNDAYNALRICDGLIITGPTGTNVNDISVALIYPKNK